MVEWVKTNGKPCKENDDPSALYARVGGVQINLTRDSLGWSVQCPTLKVNRRLNTRDREEAKVGAIRELIVDARAQSKRCSEFASILQSAIECLPADRV